MKKSRAKNFKNVNNNTLIATVDIGKFSNTGYCRCPDGKDIKVFIFFNNGQGYQMFYQQILFIKNTNKLTNIVVGIESTGSYAEPFLHFFKKRNVELVQVNPMHTKRVKELQGNSPNKTDNKDPKVIADIIELGHALTVVIPQGEAAELRRLTQARERSLERRKGLYNQLHDLVYLIFPEFLQIMKNIKSKTAKYLLKHYPTPKDILEQKIEKLSHSIKKISYGKIGEKRVEAIYESAKGSVGIEEGQSSILLEITECITSIEGCDQFISMIEQQMREKLKKIEYSKYMLSIKGIGEITTACLIGEVGDFGKFGVASEILKFAGLDLYEISSGQHRGQRRISKRGRPLMRKLLFFAAMNVVRKGGIMCEEYTKYIKRGMPKMKALIAISRKLLRILFALARDQSEYKNEYRMKNIKKENMKEAA